MQSLTQVQNIKVKYVQYIFYAGAILSILSAILTLANPIVRYYPGAAISALLVGLFFAALDFFAGWYLNSLKPLSWWIALILLALGVLGGLIGLVSLNLLSLISLLISGYGLYLILQPDVQTLYLHRIQFNIFGAGSTPTPYPQQPYYQQAPAPQAQQTTPSTTQQAPKCPVCGTPLVWVEQYKRWYCTKCQKYY
ncbi:MAG: hypothetical protein J7K23_08260 [Thermoproteales archaeon]|nr:hypothetical protein [Thermoproteales archaeon]RLF08764.1 MAG: hypothetical protein DRJ64_00160 [Thermoprotei archaeon]